MTCWRLSTRSWARGPGEAVSRRPGGATLIRGTRARAVGATDADPIDRAHAALPALSPNQVLPLVREHQGAGRQRYQLQRIGLYSFGKACGYGSTARNQTTASRDVDVWVELDPLTPYATVHLKQELLQRPVDLVRLRERMNPALRRAILQEGISA